MKKKDFGFTLAEILITLVIIGIISALTIPSVIVKYQKKHFLLKLKDTYSILSNAKLRAEVDYGPMKNWDKSPFFDTYLKPYLKLSEYNGTHVTYTIRGVAHGFYGDPFQHSSYSRYMLSNGVEISLQSCSMEIGACSIYVDLNGSKKPNVYGKDLHSFIYVSKGRFYPHLAYKGRIVPGDPQVASKDRCLVENDGNYHWGLDSCTYFIFKNNWQYPDWYPW